MFVVLCILVRGVNLVCVLPTNHQFIINPRMDTLKDIDEVSNKGNMTGKPSLLVMGVFMYTPLLSLRAAKKCVQRATCIISYRTLNQAWSRVKPSTP